MDAHKLGIERAVFIMLVAGIGFFLLAFIGLGLTPWFNINHELKGHKKTQHVPLLTPLQLKGRQIYIANGCYYCHSQFVRPVADDPLRFGAVSKAWEYKHQYPNLLSTRRKGPDLTRESLDHPADWEYVHLYDPRMIAPWSIMPAYHWMFDGSPGKPNKQGRALVAYLGTLGQARKREMLAKGTLKKVFVQGIGTVLHYPYKGGRLMSPGYDHVVYFHKAPRIADTRSARARGKHLYAMDCASCHGATGNGRGVAAQYLTPRPVRLNAFRFRASFVYKVLYYGRPGSAMPSWVRAADAFLTPRDLWSVAYYVQTLHRHATVPPTAHAPIAKTAALVKLGGAQFATNCATCHGPKGEGNGVLATALTPAPVDLAMMNPSARWVYHTINHGRTGTAMPSFSTLPRKVRWAISYFVETLAKKPKDIQSAAAAPGKTVRIARLTAAQSSAHN